MIFKYLSVVALAPAFVTASSSSSVSTSSIEGVDKSFVKVTADFDLPKQNLKEEVSNLNWHRNTKSSRTSLQSGTARKVEKTRETLTNTGVYKKTLLSEELEQSTTRDKTSDATGPDIGILASANGRDLQSVFETIGSNSCTGNAVCIFSSGTIGSYTCNGDHACYYTGNSGNAIIGDNSCNDEFACLNSGSSNGDITVGSKSCNGPSACNNAAYDYGYVNIMDNSCNGEDACIFTGSHYGAAVIYSNSCNGNDACWKAAYENGSAIVQNYSCNGKQSCQRVGHSASQPITVLENSCVGARACYKLGESSSYEHTVGINSCNGNKACQNIGLNALSSIQIGEYSCIGSQACLEAGYMGNLSIGDYSCNGYQACNFGQTKSVAVGNNSCNCKQCCKDVDSGSVIGDDQCNDENNPCTGLIENLTSAPTVSAPPSSTPSAMPSASPSSISSTESEEKQCGSCDSYLSRQEYRSCISQLFDDLVNHNVISLEDKIELIRQHVRSECGGDNNSLRRNH